MTISISRLGRPLAMTAASATMLTLIACSGPDGPPAAPSPTSSSSVSASPAQPTPSLGASASSDTSASSPTNGSSDSPAQVSNDALLAAGALGAEEVPDGTVVSIETERDGWEVHVVSTDGDEQQLRTDATGSQLVAGPTDDRPDAEDRADNRRFAEVDIDYERAVRIVEGAVDGGQITELNLDVENRRTVWEVDVSTGPQQRSVRIEAGDGRVLSNRVDD